MKGSVSMYISRRRVMKDYNDDLKYNRALAEKLETAVPGSGHYRKSVVDAALAMLLAKKAKKERAEAILECNMKFFERYKLYYYEKYEALKNPVEDKTKFVEDVKKIISVYEREGVNYCVGVDGLDGGRRV
jgi:hypothetical protein